jgi:hypothetical protein
LSLKTLTFFVSRSVARVVVKQLLAAERVLIAAGKFAVVVQLNRAGGLVLGKLEPSVIPMVWLR